MIVDQYQPQKPNPENELHKLQLMTIEARKDADEAYERLNCRVRNLFKPQKSRSGIMGMLLNNVSMVVTGINVGKKLIQAIRK